MAADVYDATLHSPLGWLGVRLADDGVAAIDYLGERPRKEHARDPLARRVVHELKAYFADPRHRFTLPLAVSGTPFQLRVWRALAAIPTGEVRTYGQIARRLRSGARAVGGACRANPVPIVVPCHRVVSGRDLGGYMGAVEGKNLHIKAWLLRHERGR